jgi:hypothetical protein
MSSILYYSNFCDHSKSLLQTIGKSPEITKDVHFVCIDKRIQKDDKIFVILENGQELVMPSNVTRVPALLLLNDNYRIVYGNEIGLFFKPRQEAVKKVVTNNNMEPQAFAIGGGGGGYGALSDSYSFLDMGPEELSAKGTGGTRQMHNFVPLDYSDSISTPQDEANYKAPKIAEELTVESLMQQREKDIQSSLPQQRL